MRRYSVLIAITTLVLTLAGCGAEESKSIGAATTATPSTVIASTVIASTVIPSTVIPSTVIPSTVIPTTTLLPTTTLAPATSPVGRGWAAIDPESITGQPAPPCCASNWYGEPSPALPASGEPTMLLDGDYAVHTTWPANPGSPMALQLFRFEQCQLLPAGSCDQADSYLPDEMGIDESASITITVQLDDHVRVVLYGHRGFSTDAPAISPVAEGNGTDLAELAIAVDDAYTTVLASRLRAGEAAADIIADVFASPTGGFGPNPDATEHGGLSFSFGDAPPLLFQAPFPYVDGQPSVGRGTDVLAIPSIEVIDGVITIYVYAGYYP